MILFTHILAFLSLAILQILNLATSLTLSPQGCRMSWMSPSYVLHTDFDPSWTPLANRYSLWLYREVGWETNELHGLPVLFIPGNAGSSHQVRSIASSATRQFYASPYNVAPEFQSGAFEPLDFFAVEFNEDLSAFHGPTLDSEKQYTARAIDYILSLYPPNTQIIILGHSMGGVVATSLLPHPNISAIITMSTPHSVPPARFDRRIEHIYIANKRHLQSDPTPILSLCGGATDLMVPSEFCIIPPVDSNKNQTKPYRRTVFTSALEGSWTGVGHREMVWCHQVRWRVARAALELGPASSPAERGVVLDTWLRDGHTLPPGVSSNQGNSLELETGEFEVLPQDLHLVLRNPSKSRTYILPIPPPSSAAPERLKFVLYLSQGSIPPTSPHNPLSLRASIYVCPSDSTSGTRCRSLPPTSLRLIPNPIPGKPFPVPDEGSDESEGVVVFQGDVDTSEGNRIAVEVQGANGRGWIVGGFVRDEPLVSDADLLTPFYTTISIDLPETSLRSEVYFPNLISNSLIVYRLTPTFGGSCSDSLLPPLLQHTSHPSESHFYPLTRHNPPILLHTHAAAPYIAKSASFPRGLNLTIYSTDERCKLEQVDVTVDWWATIGRWGVRYWSAVLSYCVGIVGWLIWDAWGVVEVSGALPPIAATLSMFTHKRLPWLLGAFFLISFIPMNEEMWLGNSGEALFAFMAPLILFISTGLVSVIWLTLQICLQITRLVFFRNKRGDVMMPTPTSGGHKNALYSMVLILLLIFLLVPWQVAFLGCWVYQFFTCASFTSSSSSSSSPRNTSSGILLAPMTPPSPREEFQPNPVNDEDEDDNDIQPLRPNHLSPPPTTPPTIHRINHLKHTNEYILLLMTCLLPLVAPVLAVWVRTLATAGLTTPFDGDHNVLYVAPFMGFVEFCGAAGGGVGGFMERGRNEKELFSPRWAYIAIPCVAFLLGPRSVGIVFEVSSVAMAGAALVRVGPSFVRAMRRRLTAGR